MTSNDKPLVLVTIAGGGWYNESCKILQRFPADRFQIAYVYGHYAHDHGGRTIPMPQPGERYGVYYHLGPTRKHLGQRRKHFEQHMAFSLDGDCLSFQLRLDPDAGASEMRKELALEGLEDLRRGTFVRKRRPHVKLGGDDEFQPYFNLLD